MNSSRPRRSTSQSQGGNQNPSQSELHPNIQTILSSKDDINIKVCKLAYRYKILSKEIDAKRNDPSKYEPVKSRSNYRQKTQIAKVLNDLKIKHVLDLESCTYHGKSAAQLLLESANNISTDGIDDIVQAREETYNSDDIDDIQYHTQNDNLDRVVIFKLLEPDTILNHMRNSKSKNKNKYRSFEESSKTSGYIAGVATGLGLSFYTLSMIYNGGTVYSILSTLGLGGALTIPVLIPVIIAASLGIGYKIYDIHEKLKIQSSAEQADDSDKNLKKELYFENYREIQYSSSDEEEIQEEQRSSFAEIQKKQQSFAGKELARSFRAIKTGLNHSFKILDDLTDHYNNLFKLQKDYYTIISPITRPIESIGKAILGLSDIIFSPFEAIILREPERLITSPFKGLMRITQAVVELALTPVEFLVKGVFLNVVTSIANKDIASHLVGDEIDKLLINTFSKVSSTNSDLLLNRDAAPNKVMHDLRSLNRSYKNYLEALSANDLPLTRIDELKGERKKLWQKAKKEAYSASNDAARKEAFEAFYNHVRGVEKKNPGSTNSVQASTNAPQNTKL